MHCNYMYISLLSRTSSVLRLADLKPSTWFQGLGLQASARGASRSETSAGSSRAESTVDAHPSLRSQRPSTPAQLVRAACKASRIASSKAALTLRSQSARVQVILLLVHLLVLRIGLRDAELRLLILRDVCHACHACLESEASPQHSALHIGVHLGTPALQETNCLQPIADISLLPTFRSSTFALRALDLSTALPPVTAEREPPG